MPKPQRHNSGANMICRNVVLGRLRLNAVQRLCPRRFVRMILLECNQMVFPRRMVIMRGMLFETHDNDVA